MGVLGLFDALRKYCRQCFRKEKLESFKRRRFALDASNLLYKDICSSGSNWLDNMIRRFMKLRKNRITPIIIFDGKAPPEKDAEKSRRKLEKNKLKSRIIEFEERLIYLNSLSEDELNEFEKSLRTSHQKNDELTFEDFEDDVTTCKISKQEVLSKQIKLPIDEMTRQQIINKLNQLHKQDVQITDAHVNTLKELVTHLGFSWIQAKGEAEEFASQLCISGKVCAVVSEDSDVLAHGCPILIRHINSSDETCEVIILREVLDGLKMDYETFVDFCIMCGNDYNDRIAGVGVVGCYNLIDAYGNLDKLNKAIIKNNVDAETKLVQKIIKGGGVEKYNYQRVRQLFREKMTNMQDLPDLKIRPVDYKNLGKFLMINNCDVMLQEIRQVWDTVEREIMTEKIKNVGD